MNKTREYKTKNYYVRTHETELLFFKNFQIKAVTEFFAF